MIKKLFVIATLTLFTMACSVRIEQVRGPSGTSCTVTQGFGGALISCADGSEAFVSNGADGLDGNHAYVEVIRPCGNEAPHSEILLRSVQGTLLAVFNDESRSWLGTLTPGVTYSTADGFSCTFTVSETGEVVSET